MNEIELLSKYGFSEDKNGYWTISRTNVGDDREDEVTLSFEKSGNKWKQVNCPKSPDGRPYNFETTDVRDVIAFTQSFIANSIHQVSGVPIDEGFSFQGTHYTSPFHWNPWYDVVVEEQNDKLFIAHPEGPYQKAYRAWRDDFAARVLNGTAKAPEEYRAEMAPSI